MRRLLLVDDDYGNRVTLAVLLDEEGYRVDEVASLREGRERLSAAGAAYDIVLLDYHLGDGHGSALLPMLRERMPAAKVFLLSGSITEQGYEGLPVDGFVPKGIAFPALLAILGAGGST